MTDEFLVQRARNISTKVEETPTDANFGDAYACALCGQEVVLVKPYTDRHGIGYRQHFRHQPDTLVQDCEWRSPAEVQEIRDEAVRSFEEEIRNRRLRLFLELDAYSDAFRLKTTLRALSNEELQVIRDASGRRPVDAISVKAPSALRTVHAQEFLPAMGSATIELQPNAIRHELQIDAPGEFELKGTWTAEGIGTHSVFVGQSDSAEYIRDVQYLSEGETVFVFAGASETPPVGSDVLQLGRHRIIRLTVERSSEAWLKKRIRSLKAIGTSPVRVSVILPFLHDPRAERFIAASPGTRCLLAVTPPENSDPSFEVVGWYGHEYHQFTLPPTGLGKPRFIEFTAPNTPGRLLVHWPGAKGRDTRLHIMPVAEKYADYDAIYPDFGVRNTATNQRALAEFGEKMVLEADLAPDRDRVVTVPDVALLGYAHLEVRLTATYPTHEGPDRRVLEGATHAEDFPTRVRDIFEAGAREVVVDFDTLGQVAIECSYYYEQRKRNERREAEARHKLSEPSKQPAPPRLVPSRPVEAPVPDPLEALQAKIRAQVSRAPPKPPPEPPRVKQPTKQSHLERLENDATLRARLFKLRPFPRRISREFASKVAGLAIKPSTRDELSAWRKAIHRFIERLPSDEVPTMPKKAPIKRVEDSHRSDPVIPQVKTPVEPVAADVSARFATPQDELDHLQIERARIESRIEELQRMLASKPTQPPQTPSAPVSRRQALKARLEKAEAATTSAEEAGTVRVTPATMHRMSRELEKRIAAFDGDLPAEASVLFVTSLYGCPQNVAEAFFAQRGKAITAALVRARRTRDA